MDGTENKETGENLANLRDEVAANIFEGTEESLTDIEEEQPQVQEEQQEEEIPEQQPPVQVEGLVDIQGQLAQILKKTEAIEQIENRLRKQESKLGNLYKKAEEKKEPEVDEAELKRKQEALNDLKEDYPGLDLSSLEGKKTFDEEELMEKAINKLREEIGDRPEFNPIDLEIRLTELKHPDFREVTQTPQYKTWLAAQSPDSQQKHFSDKADDAISLMDDFKDFRDKKETVQDIKSKRESRLERSASTPRSRKPIPKKNEANMTEDEIRAHYANEIWSE